MQLPWRSLSQPHPTPVLPTRPRPVGTAVLLGLIATGWLAQRLLPPGLGGGADGVIDDAALTATGLQTGHWWGVGTHLFVNAGPGWLTAAGVLTLALTGPALERIAGRRHLWQIFALAGSLGGLGQVGFDALLGRDPGLPVTGVSAATMGVLLALACVAPRTSLLPWGGTDGGWRRVRAVHLALLALAASLAAGPSLPVAGVLLGGLTGCLYVHALGFCGQGAGDPGGSRGEEAAAAISEASSASWPPGTPTSARTEPPGGAQAEEASNDTPTVRTASATAALNALVIPRFTARERRMTAREFIAEKVDPVLEKISREGLASLTAEERQLLQKAREKMGLP